MKDTCIICDIDWMLANNKRRSPYDMSKIKDDPVIEAVAYVIEWAYENCEVILVSGRSEAARADTEEWLAKNHIAYSQLYMRPIDDERPDTEIKKEIYEKYIEWNYHVLFALDDRFRLVNQRRDIWIFTFDVNQTREVF